MSRSISWLIVAKMPLLISSRMTSAGLTVSSSASSLTVIVAGSSTAPRIDGSTTWTAVWPNAPSRRGGLRGPRRPRVPLLLRAIDDSPAHGGQQLVREIRGKGGLQCPAEAAAPHRARDARLVTAHVRPAPVRATRRVEAGRCRRARGRSGAARACRGWSGSGRRSGSGPLDARAWPRRRLRRHLVGGALGLARRAGASSGRPRSPPPPRPAPAR